MKEDEKRNLLLNECVRYLKKSSAFQKLLAGFREKYRSLGHWGGTVVLKELSREERMDLGGFLAKDLLKKDDVRITASQMEKALSSTRFAELEWEEILEQYFGRPLITKKADLAAKNTQKDVFFKEILSLFENTGVGGWLQSVLTRHADGYSLIMQHYREDPLQLKKEMLDVLRAAEGLPAIEQGQRRKLLAVFAAEITGNPHAFDDGTFKDKLLRAFLKKKTGLQKMSGMPEAEYKKELYYQAGIIKDELSNDVLVYGICGWDDQGISHEGLEGFCRRREPVRLTLQTVGNLKSIAGTDQRAYIVENPAVFSVLVDRYPEKSFVCGNGQLNLATYILLDKLVETTKLYYAGDYDPEGLLIAQNLKQRYEEKLIIWNYNVEWYQRYHSDVILKETRLKKLDKIYVQELLKLKECIKREKKAAYQEVMLQGYVID